MKLAIAVPCCRDWKAAFGSSMIGLVRHLSGRIDFDMHIMQGASVLPKARQQSIEWAKSIEATHLLCIDDDMQFTPDVVDSLLSHDVDIVGCNYVSKATRKPLVHGIDGQQVSSLGKDGIQEIGWLGFGMVLIKLEPIKDIPAPLFETRWMEDRQDFIGEDFYFCGKVRAHGVKVYVDHDASVKITHIGDSYFREIA